jgi:hypothetical protein
MAIDKRVSAGVTVDIDGDLRPSRPRRIHLPLVVRNG